MKIRTACLDEELIWAIDDVIGGLYSIDRRTLETKCAIDLPKLFPYGKFEVQFLLKWRKDYIIVVPREIDRNWIFYNKITGETECRKIVEQRCQEVMIAIDQNRNQLYFFPLYIDNPILIIDMNTLTCLQVIENWSGSVLSDCLETAWRGAYNGQYVFFPIKNTRILVRMNCETRKVDLMELDIAEDLIDVDYAFGELWALPMRGNRLYQIDENGRIVNTVELSAKDVKDLLPDFARIVAQKRYLFLLPYYRKGIYVYDKVERKTHIISEECSVLGKKDKEVHLRYWEYCIRKNQICFLPFRDKYMEIDLDTLAYKDKELSYPDIWSDKEKISRIIWSHLLEQDSIIREAMECDLSILLKYLQYRTNMKDFLMNGHTGEKIWDMLKS